MALATSTDLLNADTIDGGPEVSGDTVNFTGDPAAGDTYSLAGNGGNVALKDGAGTTLLVMSEVEDFNWHCQTNDGSVPCFALNFLFQAKNPCLRDVCQAESGEMDQQSSTLRISDRFSLTRPQGQLENVIVK